MGTREVPGLRVSEEARAERPRNALYLLVVGYRKKRKEEKRRVRLQLYLVYYSASFFILSAAAS